MINGTLHRKESVSPFSPASTPPPTYLPPARTVVSSYVLRIFSLSIAYEEYTKNIRRNYGPGKTRTGGKYGRGECRHEQHGEREQETLCKDFGLKAGSFVVPA